MLIYTQYNTYMIFFRIEAIGVTRISVQPLFHHLAASPPVLLNPMSWPPLRSVLISDDELNESDDEFDRFSPNAL